MGLRVSRNDWMSSGDRAFTLHLSHMKRNLDKMQPPPTSQFIKLLSITVTD